MTDYDPDWPGNWEDEDEPHTEEIPGSLDAAALFRKIDSNPERVKFMQFTPMVFMYLLISPLSLLAGFLVFLLEPLPALIFFFIGFLFLLIVNLDGHMHRTVTSSLGIGGKPPFSYDTAIEWAHIEHIDVIPSKGKPAEFVFRGNGRYLWHDNQLLAKKMTLEIIASYITGFDDWTSRQKIGWNEGVLVYSRPGSRGLGPADEQGRRPIDEYDDFIGYYSSKEIVDPLSSEELFYEVKNSPACVKHTRWGNAGIVFIMALSITLVALLVLHFFIQMNGFMASLPAYLILGIVWISIICWIVREVRKHGFFLSPIGIGALETFCEPKAIRWDHIEWIDVWIRKDGLHSVSIVGNQREIKIQNSFLHRRFELEEIEVYLPDFKSWQTSRSEDWIEGITRYRRTTKE